MESCVCAGNIRRKTWVCRPGNSDVSDLPGYTRWSSNVYHGLIPFFRMYADKIDEWLNEVFPEESEASNWSDKNTEYHDIFKVLSGLNNLAERLEHLG